MNSDDDLDLNALMHAVLTCHGVSALADLPASGPRPREHPISRPPGPAGPPGIAYDATAVDISVIVFYGHRLTTVCDRLEHALRPLIGQRKLRVTVEDLDTNPEGS